MDWFKQSVKSDLPEFAEEVPVEVNSLGEEEYKTFAENAGEINFLMGQVYDASDSGDPGEFGRALARFSSYCFRMGVNYQKGLDE